LTHARRRRRMIAFRHGGANGTTGSESRDDCWRERSGGSIAAQYADATPGAACGSHQ
jgi:hypothetical protein